MGYRFRQASKILLGTKGRGNNLLQLNSEGWISFSPKEHFCKSIWFYLAWAWQKSEEMTFLSFKTIITSSWGKVDLCLQRLVQHSNGCPIHCLFFQCMFEVICVNNHADCPHLASIGKHFKGEENNPKKLEYCENLHFLQLLPTFSFTWASISSAHILHVFV